MRNNILNRISAPRTAVLLAALLVLLLGSGSLGLALAQETPEVEPVPEPAEPPVVVQEVEVIEPEAPDEPATVRINRHDTSVQIFSGLTVKENEIYNEAVAILGPLNVYGIVKGDAVAVGGPVEVTGKVGGELVSIGGPVHLGPEAEVGKLVNIGGTLDQDEGAVIHGAIQEIGGSGFSIEIDGDKIKFGDDEIEERISERIHERLDRVHERRGRGYRKTARFFGGLAWSLVSMALLLFLLAVAAVLAPRLIDRAEVKTRIDPWKSAVAGFLALVGFVPAMVAGIIFLVISVVGILLIPVFVPLMLLALVAGVIVGFAAVAQRVGGLVSGRFGWSFGRVPTIAVGAIAIYAIWLIGKLLSWIPILGWGTELIGCLIVIIAWTVGLGALLLAAFDPPRGDDEVGGATDDEPLVSTPAPPPPIPADEAVVGALDEIEEELSDEEG